MSGSSTLLPDIKVKPPGSTTPADVFNTVPLEEEEGCCQEGALVCTCMDTVDEDEEEEEEGVVCVVPGRLDTVNAGLIRSCRKRQTGRARLSRDTTKRFKLYLKTPETQQPISISCSDQTLKCVSASFYRSHDQHPLWTTGCTTVELCGTIQTTHFTALVSDCGVTLATSEQPSASDTW